MEQRTIDARQLIIFIYDQLLARGAPPTSRDIAAHFGSTPDLALRALNMLNVGKTVLLNPRTGEIWMAGPFSAVPTPYEVSADGVRWWANCAWDMLGIPVVADRRVHIDAACTDCGEPMVFDVDPRQPTLDAEGVVHFLLPARRWYEDIGFT